MNEQAKVLCGWLSSPDFEDYLVNQVFDRSVLNLTNRYAGIYESLRTRFP